jgi:predicted ATPase/DNA-binding winged helix-turn-helix (wHTH) protein
MQLPDYVCFSRFELLPAERKLLDTGCPVELGARAFDLLIALAERRDRLVSKAELLELVWSGLVVEEANLPVQMSGLRKLIGAQVIVTVPGRGYRFVAGLHHRCGLPVDRHAEVPIAAPNPQSNVPAESDILIGRGADVAELSSWLTERRLVTVLGAGGIGKTRLAQAVARARVGLHVGGVWWIDLAALTTAPQIASAVAATMQLRLGEGDTTTILVRTLAKTDTLLVLDSCEHLISEVGLLARAILAAAPGVRLLATSQELLQVPGERVYRLDTLAVPPPGTPLHIARGYSAMQLLEHRARASDQRFRLDAASVDAAMELCRRLDGIALAIEMAAARLPALGAEPTRRLVAERLLRNADLAAPAHHRTLSTLFDWSHALLDATEQAVLRRLSVFVGSFRLELAQRVAADDEIDDWAVLDAVAALVDKSLLQVGGQQPRPRYRLLANTRLCAAERLDAAGEAGETYRRHGLALAGLADAAMQAFSTSSDAAWLSDHADDHDDWRLAFERACERRDPDVAASTGRALCRLDRLRGDMTGDRERGHAVLALAQHPGREAALSHFRQG